MRTIEGYTTDWDDTDQVGVYDAPCGGDDGDEPIESFVSVGENNEADADERFAVIDQDADGEGPGVVSMHSSREAALQAAHDYIAAQC